MLYALVTDVGFQHRDSVIWETLNSLHGDTHLVDCHFREAVAHGAGGGFEEPHFDLLEGVEDDAAIARRFQAESDAAFARSLQQQLDEQHGGGRAMPVGKLRVVGVEEETGKEILEDEAGHRFVRRNDPGRKAPKKKQTSSGDDDSDDKSKCVLC